MMINDPALMRAARAAALGSHSPALAMIEEEWLRERSEFERLWKGDEEDAADKKVERMDELSNAAALSRPKNRAEITAKLRMAERALSEAMQETAPAALHDRLALAAIVDTLRFLAL